MSIIPLLIAAPIKTPVDAIIRTFLKDAALDPIAEFRKLTASLLTPTDKSKIANMNKKIITQRKSISIVSLTIYFTAKKARKYFINISKYLSFY